MPQPEKVAAKGQLNDLNEPPTCTQEKGKTVRDYLNDLCTPEAND